MKNEAHSTDDIQGIRQSLRLARHAESLGEVPVGAIVVHQGQIIGEGWNAPIAHHDPSAHAEIVALRAAAQTMKNYRLPECTLYVTLEPCVMCLGAILHARIGRLVFAASDPKAGAVMSKTHVHELNHLNVKLSWQGGILADEAGQLLKNFFRSRRKRISMY